MKHTMYHLLTVNARTQTEINIPHINFVKEKSLDFGRLTTSNDKANVDGSDADAAQNNFNNLKALSAVLHEQNATQKADILENGLKPITMLDLIQDTLREN